MVIEWVERVVKEEGAEDIVRTAETPAVLEEPIFDGQVWRVTVQADPGTSAVVLGVNDAEIEVSLDASGRGEVTLAYAPGVIYEVVVVGAPEALPGVPAPGCRKVLEV